MTTDEYRLNLAHLPSDIIRNIARTGMESIDGVMLISPRWNALARELLNDKKRLPPIIYLTCNMLETAPTLSMRISSRFRNYFGMRSWRIRSIDWDLCNGDSTFLIKKIANRGKTLDVINKLFARCSRIQRFGFKVDLSTRKFEIGFIKKALEEVAVEELEIQEQGRSFEGRPAFAVLDIVQYCPIPRIIVSSSHHYFSNGDMTTIFISDAMQFVHSIQLVEGGRNIPLHAFGEAWRDFANELKHAGFSDVQIDMNAVYDEVVVVLTINHPKWNPSVE